MANPYPTRGIVTAANLAALYADTEVFPSLPGRDWMVSKTPMWSTQVQTAANGSEVRAAWYSAPKYAFRLQHPVLRDMAAAGTFGSELQQIIGFFNARRGRYGFFFFYDPNDNTATNEAIGISDGATSTFQLVRTVAKGTPFAAVEPVYALWGNPTSVTVGGTAKNAAAAASATITFGSNPAANDTITITPVGGSAIVIGFVSSGAAGWQVNIGATAAATAANLATLLQNSAPVGGSGGVTATVSGTVVTVAAWTAGTAGNSIALAKSSTALTLSGATLSGGAANDYSVSPWGVITFTVTPTAGLTIAWSGTFLFTCRFDTDSLELHQLMSYLWEQQGFPFLSIFP